MKTKKKKNKDGYGLYSNQNYIEELKGMEFFMFFFFVILIVFFSCCWCVVDFDK